MSSAKPNAAAAVDGALVSPYARGQQPPKLSPHQPLSLSLDSFVPHLERHVPQGVVPDEILPEGEQRPRLFDANVQLGEELFAKNRIIVSPMCQYSSRDGFLTPYHLAHLGAFALHGVGTIMIEASGVTSNGRITPEDAGIWKREQLASHTSIVSALKSFSPGLTVGIQLAHAGRKASAWSPFHKGERKNVEWVTKEEGGWPDDVVGPSAVAYGPGWIVPRQLEVAEIESLVGSFVQSAEWALDVCGYDFVELHAAHGYLLHSFLSPLSNKRTDAYGGPLPNRARFLLDIVRAVRSRRPRCSLWVRISASDFAEEHTRSTGEASFAVEEAVEVAKMLEDEGVDVIDVSAGGLTHLQKIKTGPAYQLPFAAAIRSALHARPLPKASSGRTPRRMVVGSVGMMEPTEDGEDVGETAVREGKADVVLSARGFLARPTWAEEAAVRLMGTRSAGNAQYHRVRPAKRSNAGAKAGGTK